MLNCVALQNEGVCVDETHSDTYRHVKAVSMDISSTDKEISMEPADKGIIGECQVSTATTRPKVSEQISKPTKPSLQSTASNDTKNDGNTVAKEEAPSLKVGPATSGDGDGNLTASSSATDIIVLEGEQ